MKFLSGPRLLFECFPLIAVTVSSAIAAVDLVKCVVSPDLKSIIVVEVVGDLVLKLGRLHLVEELGGRVYKEKGKHDN